MPDLCRRCKAPLPESAKFCPACGTKQAVAKGRRRRGNGTGSAYKRGKTWTAVYIPGWKDRIGEDGKPKKTPAKRTKGGFATKQEALDYVPVLRGGKPRKTTTLAKLYASWENTKMVKLNDTNQRAYRKAFERIASIAYLDITTLTIDDLQTVADEQGETFYNRRHIKDLLAHLYKRAMALQIVAVDLSKFIELPERNETETVPFSAEELQALWEDYGQGNVFTGYVLLMIYTGMMPGELFICSKSMIDWERHEIFGCGLKTKLRRETPMVFPEFIGPVLRELCALEPNRSRLLAMSRDAFYTEFQAMKGRCKCRKVIRGYSCRHTTATALALVNTSLPVIQKAMRQKRITTTQGYIHLELEPVRAALNNLPGPPTDNIPTTFGPETQ